MVNTRLSVAIHILSLIAANPRESSEMIAGSVNTNPVVIRRMISQLKKGGILTSRPGVAGATLKRDPEDISLLDIYRAVQPQEELFAIHDKPNPNCPVGRTFHSVQQAMENELASKSLKDVLTHLF
jgi:DNA-binding IscR family transcriptional regulator